jgi:glycerol-3-phosphate dehydrogenase subunit B
MAMTLTTRPKADLIVIGRGLAGMAATAFAVERGLRTIQVGLTSGELPFFSGLLDLLGRHPVDQETHWEDPWSGIGALLRDCPEHPYARLGLEKMHKGLEEFFEYLHKAGLPYVGWPDGNAVLATCAGTFKTTYKVPETMWPGVIGFKEGIPALIVDFTGMKDFSGRQMVETIGARWPGLRSQRLDFPARWVDGQNVTMAEALGISEIRTALAAAVRPVLKNAELVGMPAILGLQGSDVVADDLARQIGVPVFEIPTLPPSVPGIRLKETMERELRQGGNTLVAGRRALAVASGNRRCEGVVVERGTSRETLEARGIVLATGRFLGGGLAGGRRSIRETLLDLPVHQPGSRQGWHRADFFDPRGHPVNRAGLEVDDLFRPLGSNGSCAFENLFAAGSVLAHQDWMRMKSGAGLAITTAYGAVHSFMKCK